MNLAFPALCILMIVLPGIIYRKAYTRGALPIFFPFAGPGEAAINKYPMSVRPLSEEVGVSLIAAILLHVVWLTTCSFVSDHSRRFDFRPDYQQIVHVLYGDLTKETYPTTLNYIADHHVTLTIYFLSLYLFSFGAARVSLFVVRRLRLDHNWMLFRLEDQWFYFLRGEVFQFKEFRRFIKLEHPISGNYISVVIPQGDSDYLYKGFLWDFHLDREGNLDRLLLHNVIRAKFDQPKKESGASDPPPVANGQAVIVDRPLRFERISSQLFTVKYADCKTLACTYFYIEEIRKNPPREAAPIVSPSGKASGGGATARSGLAAAASRAEGERSPPRSTVVR